MIAIELKEMVVVLNAEPKMATPASGCLHVVNCHKKTLLATFELLFKLYLCQVHHKCQGHLRKHLYQ